MQIPRRTSRVNPVSLAPDKTCRSPCVMAHSLSALLGVKCPACPSGHAHKELPMSAIPRLLGLDYCESLVNLLNTLPHGF
jgi:hypothetical protein